MQVNPSFPLEILPIEVQDYILQYLTVEKRDISSLLCVSRQIRELFAKRLRIENNQFANSFLSGYRPNTTPFHLFESVACKTKVTLTIMKESGQMVPDDMLHMQKMLHCLSIASNEASSQIENANRRIIELARIQV